ncbi:hypothetical protein [Plantactinospora sp. DSM 117369]
MALTAGVCVLVLAVSLLGGRACADESPGAPADDAAPGVDDYPTVEAKMIT